MNLYLFISFLISNAIIGFLLYLLHVERKFIREVSQKLQTFILAGIDERREILSRPVEVKKKDVKHNIYDRIMANRILRKEDRENLEVEDTLQ